MKKYLIAMSAALLMAAGCGKEESSDVGDSLTPYVVQEGCSALFPDICGPWHCDSAFRPTFFADSSDGMWERVDVWQDDNIRLNADYTALHNGQSGVWVIFDSFLTINTPDNAAYGIGYGYDFGVVELTPMRLVMQRRSESAYMTYWSRPK